MKSNILILFALLVLVSCSDNKKSNLLTSIKNLEDSVMSYQQKNPMKANVFQDSLLSELNTFWKIEKKDTNAAKVLDKMQMLYSIRGEYVLSSKFADTLLNTFPKYKMRRMVIESQIANYDFFIQPRDTVKIKSYINQLFKEFPKLEREKRKEYEYKLQHLGMNFEELIKSQNK